MAAMLRHHEEEAAQERIRHERERHEVFECSVSLHALVIIRLVLSSDFKSTMK